MENIKLFMDWHNIKIEYRAENEPNSIENQIAIRVRHHAYTNNHGWYTYIYKETENKKKEKVKTYLRLVEKKGRIYLRVFLSNKEPMDVSLSRIFYVWYNHEDIKENEVIIHCNGNNLDFRQNNLKVITRRSLLINNLTKEDKTRFFEKDGLKYEF